MNGTIKHSIKSDHEAIAVIGMAMRLPGGVRSGDDFWKMLAEKRSGLSKYPPNRMNPSGHLDCPTGMEAHFLQDVDIREFDPSVFPMPRKELAQLDPVQRQLLTVTYECMEDAGSMPQDDTNKIGCYVGASYSDWKELHDVDTLQSGSYRMTGTSLFTMANRISYEFDLHGPSTNAMFVPSASAQEALIRRAYDEAGIEDLGQTAMFECHGTGTAVGDVVETEAVGRCFGKDGVIITSVKPNVGHSEPASGITSLIKAILAIERRQVPPNILFETPNPNVPFEQYKLHVPVEVEQWPEGRAERVSVSSYGVGGANAHVIVDSLAQYRCDQAKSHSLAWSLLTPNKSESHGTQLLVLSAASDASLGKLVDSYQAYVKDDKVPLADVSFTLARRRRHKAHRAYAIAEAGELLHVSAGQDSPTPSRILWVFNGQGSQWAGMGAELLDANPVFRELRKTAGFSLVGKAELMATLIVAVQIGLIDVLRSWKITPDMVVGHSSGEIAAAYASGAITAQAAISAAFFRGASCSETEQAGAMAAVGLGPLEVAPYLEAGVVIACKNSQTNVTLSGDAGQVDKVVRKLKQSLPDVLIRRLKVEMAYHSHHMLKCGAKYEEKMFSLFDSVEPAVAFFSSNTGDRLKGEHSLGPAYWRANLENPVEFNAAVRSALGQEGDRVLIIEIGPHHTLRGPLGQIVKDMGRQGDVPWLTGHKIGDQILLPAAASIAMVGEALRQLKGKRAYSLRNVSLSAALTVPAVETVQVVTSLTRELLDVKNPWYSFTISSHDGFAWTRCVSGEARAGIDVMPPNKSHGKASFERVVDEGTWYKSVGNLGYNYDGLFRGLREVKASPVRRSAAATAPSVAGDEGYAIHPVTIDFCLQAMMVAFAQGLLLDYSNLVESLAHRNPRMKVLEVGAGTCATTAKMLRMLTSAQGRPMYESYLITDISAGFMVAAKERFADYQGVEYGAFDITRDPKEQGLNADYNLIIATNVVHATPNLTATLRNLRGLLSNEGRLFLTELNTGTFSTLPLSPGTVSHVLTLQLARGQVYKLRNGQWPASLEVCRRTHNRMQGFLPGWWEGVDDGRELEPYITPDKWGKRLLSAGFRQPYIVESDDESPYGTMTTMIAAPQIAMDPPAAVTLLCHKKDGPYVQELTDSLQARGIFAEVCIFGQPLPRQDTFCLLDLQSPILHDLNETSFGILINYLKILQQSDMMIWVTPASQTSCQDPRCGLINGFARSVRTEIKLRLYTIELDAQSQTPNATSAAILTDLYLHSRKPRSSGKVMRPDCEFAIVDGNVLVPRLDWMSWGDAWARSASQHNDNCALIIGKPGSLQTIEWTAEEREEPGHGEVIVKVKAIGINFRDVVSALGLICLPHPRVGFEGSGVVVEVGEGVQELSVGDRVFFIAKDGVSSYTRISQARCRKFGDDLRFEEAAGVPTAFATVVAAIVDKARMSPGQTILIHSACGAVGLAAIQVARLQDAKVSGFGHGFVVFLTLRSNEKRDFLVRQYGIPTSHIFYSRDSSFLHDIMEATGGRGVDVVLNSLAGDLLQASWKCVAKFGTMIELGKMDMRRRQKLDMSVFEDNRTFTGLSVDMFDDSMFDSLFTRTASWLASGAIRCFPVTNMWGFDQAQEAFKAMLQGNHIGKMTISVPDDVSSIPTIPQMTARLRLRPDHSYLLVGGTGGLGMATSTWLAEKGARHLIFLSRSAGNTSACHNLIDELGALGCAVQMVRGDAANPADVEKAVKQAAKPIAGVINFAMVLKNIDVFNMTFSDWSEVFAPKVRGTWNLHNLVTTDLDFFVLCSSICGVVGKAGQVNYSACGSFLDSFVKFRRQKGLVASVIDLGAVAGYLQFKAD
ncbi:hypothetical protein L249_6098 [Ophiocordyceps polyrhachis-furcata BCC 54312]|uniref:Carrier domain-containing protein n=1 Tax=Ophiocordyceps polyrhachis-furcata BCC 54312 TaxID=1330021 RepID=A0A367LJ85_9HYPO|nr:hypothetical protein L249_6098 [Ophiocordyceps polyrhachis-furcata BCC 54312]